MARQLSRRMPEWKVAKAKEMASSMTAPEKALWQRLCSKKLGVWIYKQRPMLGYIADFWVPCGIVIEVDGPHHEKRKGYDAKRDKVFAEKGIKTLRFSDMAVRNNLDAVIALIKRELKKAGQKTT